MRWRARPWFRSGLWLVLGLLTGSAASAVTKTYENGTNVAVPCAGSQTSNIVVSDVGTITDLNVVNVTHQTPYLGRTTITLTDPTGTVTVQVKDSGVGGSGDGITNIDFDDAAASAFPDFLSDGSCLSNQTYQSYESLSAFNGLGVNGTWTLTVSNSSCSGLTDCDCSIASGPACPRELDNWGLEITFSCESVTVSDETIATMQTRQGCRLLTAGPALVVTTSLGATFSAGESVAFASGFSVGTAAKLTAGTCSHNICDQNLASPLSSSCMACVEAICAVDTFCCTVFWDGQCVSEVGSICGLGC